MSRKNLFLPYKLAWESFKKNKLRTVLTLFGIMIGISMVIIVLSAGQGVKGLILDEVSSFGDNWINVEVKVPSAQRNSQENFQDIASGVSITTLTDKDAKAVEQLDNIEHVYSGVTTQVVASYLEEKVRPTVFGVSASYNIIDKSEVEQGRFFTDEEDKSASQVIVLGSEISNQLFANTEPIGKIIKLDGKAFRVVGVMEEIGSTGFFDMDKIVYIPLKTTQKKIMGINHVLWFVATTKNNDLARITAEEITWLMRDRHEITDIAKDDFAVTTQEEALSIIENVVVGISVLLVVLSAISLVVGGVGIMNVMYVSVAERTFEIGLRKAVGATNKNILWQFLLEAVLITSLGGIAGILGGIFISFLVAQIAQSQGLSWPFVVSIFSIVLSVGFSTTVGLIFGLYPARRASKLDPIVAIRKE